MGLRINTNLPALNINRQVQEASLRLVRGFEGLASGLRINRARDDAAGLAIAEALQRRVRQYGVEVNNLQTGLNAAQTAEGGLTVQQEAVQRIRELAVQAATGTLSEEGRAALNAEAQQLIEQINETAESTQFNGIGLLNGSQPTIPLGTEGGAVLNLNESTAASLGLAGLDLSTPAGAESALGALDTALNRISQDRGNLGAQMSRFERGIATRENAVVNATEAESRIRDLDFARAVIEQTRNRILTQAGIGLLAQSNLSGANALRLLGQ